MSTYSRYTNNNVFIKLVIFVFFLVITFRLFLYDSIGFAFISSSSSDLDLDHVSQQQLVSDDFAVNTSSLNNNNVNADSKCDIFTGDWVADPSNPTYTNESCEWIEHHQNCMRNGRPDYGFLHWSWKPRDCDLPKFNPKTFLTMMTNKSWAFIGDSISRNHVQSLLCMLSQAKRAVEVYHDQEYKTKRWHFPSHNFTLSVIWTPFLVKADIFEDNNGVSTSEVQVSLDQLDNKWTDQYREFDYVIISGGKWFLKTSIYKENNTIIGCHYCPGRNLTEVRFEYAYRKAIRLVFNFLTSYDHKALVFFRTITPDHFENGEWFSGGTCNRTRPFQNGEINTTYVDMIMRGIELEEFENATTGSLSSQRNRAVLKLFDTTGLSLLRPDGHPGPFRNFQPFRDGRDVKVINDCLHWCLPGPIDSWNDLLMNTLLRIQS